MVSSFMFKMALNYFIEYQLHADKNYDQNEFIIFKTSLF